jgi:hypothetical protein
MQAKIILNRGSKMNLLKNATKYVELGLTALGAMEEDFECSGMCAPATFYSFSDASKGVPEYGCKAKIVEFLDNAGPYAAGWMWTFGILTLFCAIFMSLLWTEKHNLIHSPLLGK